MSAPLHGIGHNSGRVLEPGKAWRTHVWRKARRDLMPTLPIEVVRRRVARAKELGLPYKTYAGLRASSGDDLIGFMFSSNALDVLRRSDIVPASKVAKLDSLKDAKTIVLTHAPVTADQVCPPAELAYTAPKLFAEWADARSSLQRIFAQSHVSAGRLVLITDQTLERDWVGAGRMAGSIPTSEFFAP